MAQHTKNKDNVFHSQEKRQSVKSNHDQTLMLNSNCKESIYWWLFKSQFSSDILSWAAQGCPKHKLFSDKPAKYETPSLAFCFLSRNFVLNSVLFFSSERWQVFSPCFSCTPHTKLACPQTDSNKNEGINPPIPFFQLSTPLQNLPAFIHSPVPSDCLLICLNVQSLEWFSARDSDPVKLTQHFHGNIFVIIRQRGKGRSGTDCRLWPRWNSLYQTRPTIKATIKAPIKTGWNT